MPAHACSYPAQPVIAGEPCLVTVINLDGFPTLRVTQGRWLVGYFPTPAAADAAGVDFEIAEVASA